MYYDIQIKTDRNVYTESQATNMFKGAMWKIDLGWQVGPATNPECQHDDLRMRLNNQQSCTLHL